MGDPPQIPDPGPDTNRPVDPAPVPRPDETPPLPNPMPGEIPVEEPPAPDQLPDEVPLPNPDEVREPPQHV
ncbi:hypothetical protein [Phyllobacterium sp. SB3]|uniref:hypothetical protein n=1 Tax=Phyllobacterium sp. SB3 TaxID=3156073 RepID=UPI0032AFF39D